MTDQIQISDDELREIAAGWPTEFRIYPAQGRGASTGDLQQLASSFVTVEK